MRKIKFRGFNNSNSEWNYGNLVIVNDEYHIIDQEEYEGVSDYTSVDKNSVGQFIGLYDSLEEEIFEGDILRQTVGDIDTDFTVIYNSKNGKFQKQFENKGGKISLSDFSWVDFEHSELKVIGNIYENK